MLYAFIDERYRFTKEQRFLAASCIAIPQYRYNPKVVEVRNLLQLGKLSILELLDKLLVSLDGFAV